MIRYLFLISAVLALYSIGTKFCIITHHSLTPSLCRLRLVLWSGLDAGSVVLFDSGRGGQIPFEGVISEGPAVRIQFITDQPNHNTGFNIRYEGAEATVDLVGHKN